MLATIGRARLFAVGRATVERGKARSARGAQLGKGSLP